MGLGIKLESNRSENKKKSAGTGLSVNLPRLNNILSLNIPSVCNFFNAVLVTGLWNQGQGWDGSIKIMIWNNWMYIHIFLKIRDHRYIKTQIYSSTFYVQTWLLLIKEESNFVSEPKTEVCEVLYITTGIIGGFILYDLFWKKKIIGWKWLPSLPHCSHVFSDIILAEYSVSMLPINLTV